MREEQSAATTPDAAAVDAMQFRAAMGAFATGVAIVTTQNGDSCQGMAINSLTSVSLDPCQVLFCAKSGSVTGRAVKHRGAFAINLLAGDQQHLVKQFCANPQERFAGVPMDFSACGLPLIHGSLVHLCCTVADIHVSGDHDIIVGRVHALANNDGDPLVFFRGGYGGYVPAATPAPSIQRLAV